MKTRLRTVGFSFAGNALAFFLLGYLIAPGLSRSPLIDAAVLKFDFVPREYVDTREETQPPEESRAISDKTSRAADRSLFKEGRENVPAAENTLLDEIEKVPGERWAQRVERSPKEGQEREVSAEGKSVPKRSKGVPPVSLSPGGGGEGDAYLSGEASRESAYAEIFNEIAHNAEAASFGEYLKRFKDRVAPIWQVHMEGRGSGLAFAGEEAGFLIQILPDGRLGGLHLWKESGDHPFNRLCRDSILQAAPFPPVPEEFRENPLWIGFTFLGAQINADIHPW